VVVAIALPSLIGIFQPRTPEIVPLDELPIAPGAEVPTHAVTADGDSLYLHDLRTGDRDLFFRPGDVEFAEVAVQPGSRSDDFVVAASALNADGALQLVHVVDGLVSTVEELRIPDGPPTSLAWSADGSWLAWASGGTELLWVSGGRQLVRLDIGFAFGAGITLGLIPTTDAPRDDPPGITRSHRRGYMTIETLARYYAWQTHNVEGWIGAGGGLVVVSDTFVSDEDRDQTAFVGTPGVTLRTEGLSLLAGAGVSIVLSE
jgi:hypothetical protein